MKVRFIINPVAGGANRTKEIADAVRRILDSEKGIFEIKVAGSKGDAGGLSEEAVSKGYEAIFACGGDGTINEVASHLVGTETALGVIPKGSGNGFAKSLGIPEDVNGAVSLLKTWNVKRIDAGVICGRYFFSTAGCGFDARMSKKYDEGFLSRRLRGLAPYVPIALWEYFFYKPMPVTIKTEGSSREAKPFLLTAANTERYGGGAVIAPGALPDDGLLDICVVKKPNILKATALAYRLLKGDIDKYEGFDRFRSNGLTISGNAGFLIHADGEPFEWSGDVRVSLVPKGLKVLVR